MKNLNEVKEIDNFDAFEIIDLEEKLDYKDWTINGLGCQKCGSEV